LHFLFQLNSLSNHTTQQILINENLSSLFLKVLAALADERRLYVDSSVDTDRVQVLVQRSVDETEKAVCMVNELSLFATNEDVEEIATSDLRFLLRLVSVLH